MSNGIIAAAIAKLQAQAATRVVVTVEDHLQELAKIRDAAFEAKQYSAASQAEVNRGKALGFYTERVEHSGSIARPMSDEERESRIMGLLETARRRYAGREAGKDMLSRGLGATEPALAS
jgi:hypothetical protein